MKFGAALVLVALLAWPGLALADAEPLPPAAVKAIREFGPVQNGETIALARRLMTPLQRPAPASVRVEADLAYGADERQKLDVFVAEDGGAAKPVLVFVHGGGFVGGAKSAPDSPFYRNIGYRFAADGFLAVNVTYRLAPLHPWPAGSEDVGAALAWVRESAARYGGDPEHIVLVGHSAGATHVAGYVFLVGPPHGDGVVGAVLVSGAFDPASFRDAPNTRAYFGSDVEEYAARNPVAAVERRRIPLLVAMAEYDPPAFQLEATRLFAAVCRRDGRCPRLYQAQDHNHMTEIYSIDSADDRLAREIADFARRPS
jgi:acetyl esterase